MRTVANTSLIRIRGAGRSIAVHLAVAAVDTKAAAVAVAVAAEAGVILAAPVTMPIYRREARTTRRLRTDQRSQEAMRSATNSVATMANARSTHTAAVNSAVGGSARAPVENRVVIRVASRRAVVRAAAHVAVAVVKADSRGARARVVAAETADRAVAVVASRAWVETGPPDREPRAALEGRAGRPH